MLPVVLSTAAELDLADIWDHIAQDNRPAANRILDLIQARLQSIARFPKIGAAYPKLPTISAVIGSVTTAFFIVFVLPPLKLLGCCTAHGTFQA